MVADALRLMLLLYLRPHVVELLAIPLPLLVEVDHWPDQYMAIKVLFFWAAAAV